MRIREIQLFRRRSIHIAAVLTLCICGDRSLAAEDWSKVFTDPLDGRFDASQWLLDRRGFLPVPIVITEPAVGYGGGIALAFFHRRDDAPPSTTEQSREFTPPSVSVLMAAATENGTRLAAAGHLGIWRDDTLRYLGGIAAVNVNLTFYGGAEFPRISDGVGYNLNGWGTLQQLTWRIGASDMWFGPQLVYLKVAAGLDTTNGPTNAASFAGQLIGDIDNLGVGVTAQYDSRDNIFTPSRGIQAEWYVRQHRGTFRDDFEYTEIDVKNRWYLEPDPRWVVGLRLDMSAVSGDAPFYALPFINQRGIPKMRYQGEAVIATEVEARYAVDSRWFAVAFTGVGRAADSFHELGSDDSRWSGGLGARYLISRILGLQVGLDIARGPEEWAVYLQAGNGWQF